MCSPGAPHTGLALLAAPLMRVCG